MRVTGPLEGSLVADRRLYLNAAGAVVEADSPDRVKLLAAAGTTISPAEVTRLGLTRGKDGKLRVGPEPEEEAPAAEAEPESEEQGARRRGR